MRWLKFLKVTFIMLYLLIMSVVIASICSVKYFCILPVLKNSTIVAFLCIFVVPILTSVVVHIKTTKNSVGREICKLAIMLLVLVGAAVNGGLFLLGGVCSYTTDISNYHQFDDRVTELVSRAKTLLPDEIPENAQDVTYQYLYQQTLDDEIAIILKYRYDKQSTFDNEKEQIAQNENIILTEKIEGRDIHYTAKGDRSIFVIFDKKEQTVTFGHFQKMDEFEIKDMLENM